MQSLFPFIVFFTSGFNSFAQEENWDVYMAQFEKGVGSVMIDLALKKSAPVQQLPFIVITGVTFKNCTAEGMPEKDEFVNLYKVSDSVKNIISKIAPRIISAGTFTYQCERLDYYYVSDTIGLRNKLLQMYSVTFPAYLPYMNIKEDKKWQAYLEFLYPNEEIMEYMKNQKVVLRLSEAGDKLEKERKVDHWAYFADEAGCNCFINYCKEHNFFIEGKEKVANKSLSYKIQISRVDKVTVAEISQVTLELAKQAEKCNGDYDGWETFIVK